MTDYPVIDKIVADFNASAREAKTLAEQLALAYDLTKTQSEGLAVAIESMTAKEWQSIETAPKDGVRILAFGKLGFESETGIGTVAWCETYSKWQCDPNEATEYNTEACELSHWMPLPKPPQTDKP